MKKIPGCLLLLIVLLAVSCKKKDHVDTSTVRLTKLESWNSNALAATTTYTYDGQGRVTQMNTTNTNGPATSVSVSYNGNEIILSKPDENTSAMTFTQSTRLKTDGNGRLLQKIDIYFTEFKSPFSNPQRTYYNDTINYEYDGAGLIKKEIHSSYDSTWYNPGVVQTIVIRMTGATNYTSSGGNVVSFSKQLYYNTVTKQQSTTIVNNKSTEETANFSYSKKYPNKTDFSNTAVVHLYFFPFYSLFNKASANLPDKLSGTLTDKDQNGNVIHTDNYSIDPVLTYNSYGFLSTITPDPASPDNKSVLIYNK